MNWTDKKDSEDKLSNSVGLGINYRPVYQSEVREKAMLKKEGKGLSYC